MKFLSVLVMVYCQRFIVFVRLFSVFIMAFFGAAQAFAEVNLAVTANRIEGENIRIWYSIDWSTNDTTRTTCVFNSWCNVYFDIVLNNSLVSNGRIRTWTLTDQDTRIPGRSGALTLGDVITILNWKGDLRMPYSSSILLRNRPNVMTWCFRLTISEVPISNCAPAPAPPLTCDIVGDTTIDHKLLLDTALNGAQASTRLNIKCNSSLRVTVRATRTNSYGVRLRSDDSLYSEVKINNQDATDGVSMSVTNDVDRGLYITSTLVTRGAVAAGPFSGSTVITVSPD